MHRSHAGKIPREDVAKDLVDAAVRSWDEALSLGERFGFKNAQISVIAPTGTIAFMMDCDYGHRAGYCPGQVQVARGRRGDQGCKRPSPGRSEETWIFLKSDG